MSKFVSAVFLAAAASAFGDQLDLVTTRTTVERSVYLMGTRLDIQLDARDRMTGLNAIEAAVAAIAGTEKRLSTWRSDSELARVNVAPAGVATKVSKHLAADLDDAFRCAAATDNAFNPAVGPLIQAWGLRGKRAIPDKGKLRRALIASSPARFIVDRERESVVRRTNDAAIEEGGFGKGVGLDDAMRQFDGLIASGQVGNVILNFGGQITVAAVTENHPAEVAHPRIRDKSVIRWNLSSSFTGSLSTSGNSEKATIVEGVSMGHIIDPRLGTIVPRFNSVTVAARRGVVADCLSTALFVMGRERGMAWAEARRDIDGFPVDVLFVEQRPASKGLRADATCGLRGLLESLDPGIEIVYHC